MPRMPNERRGRSPGRDPHNGRVPIDEEEGELDPFEQLVRAAIESLPHEFRDRLGSVAIVVEDEPTQEELDSVGARGLFGLYTGVPRTAWGVDNFAVPSKITIYRNSHLQRFRTPEALAAGVADTVRHEVAHHFGISDARLDELAREGHGH